MRPEHCRGREDHPYQPQKQPGGHRLHDSDGHRAAQAAEWVRIYVGGCDARELSQITPELTTALAGLSDHIKLIPLADDESGTCIIEMPDEIIDASVSTQIHNLRDILHGG